MRMKLLLPIFAALCLLAACTESPESTTPTSTPTTVAPSTPTESLAPAADVPDVSAEEMSAFLWEELPNKLPDGYTKSQFLSETGEATYLENGKWEFCLSGSGNVTKLLPQKNYEKTPGNWFLNRSQEVTRYKLMLTATYYEKTGTLDILDIQKLEEETTVETTHEEPILGEGVRVEWASSTFQGANTFRLEGLVENIGIVPLENVSVQLIYLDMDGNILGAEEAPLSPNIINKGERAKFLLEYQQEIKIAADAEPDEQNKYIIGSYFYRFVLPSGEELYTEYPE